MAGAGKLQIQITDEPIVPEDVTSLLEAEECGAVVNFAGRVRSRSGDRTVAALEHSASGQEARSLLEGIARELRDRWGIEEIALSYRTGPVPPGEVTLVVAIATHHRPEAFAACQHAVDRFKQEFSAKETLENGEARLHGKG